MDADSEQTLIRLLRTARYVAGFGKAFNLRQESFRKLALDARDDR